VNDSFFVEEKKGDKYERHRRQEPIMGEHSWMTA
jgi:hypothetical protein